MPIARSGCLLLFLLAAIPAARADVRTVQRVFPAASGGTVAVDTYRGILNIGQSADGKIHVEVLVDTGTEDNAESDRLYGQFHVAFKTEGGKVSIVATNPGETGMHLTVGSEERKMNVAFNLLVPASCNLKLETRDGGVSVGDIAGRLAVRAKKGTIFFRHVDGEIKAENDNGDIVLSRCSGTVSFHVTRGSIRAGTVGGRADLQSTDGDIELQHALGGVTAKTDVGDVTVGMPAGFTQPSDIRTSDGGIWVKLDPAAHCAIRASSVWGHVHTTLPIAAKSGGDGKKSLVGSLNGGGPELALRADGGQVHIDPPRT